LKQAKGYAVFAENDATKLESYTRSKVSWQLHAKQLQRIRKHVNELGQLNKQLSGSRAEGSPWQADGDRTSRPAPSGDGGSADDHNQSPQRQSVKEGRRCPPGIGFASRVGFPTKIFSQHS
jgi:hypothetical protein